MSAKVLLWLRRAVIATSVVWGALLLLVVAQRVGFPLELEWMEGGVLHQASRFAEGEAMYPPPGRDFVPFLYTPAYPVVVGGLGRIFGLNYALARIVSILSCVALGWALWRAVGREGKPTAHRALAVGLLCSGYVFTFRWLDLGRPDAMYMAATLWALVLLREAWGDHRKAVLAGALMALAFWTKQTAVIFVLASGAGALIVAPRQLWSYALTIAVLAGGGVLLGNSLTEGWLWHYIYELHQSHAFNDERFNKKTWGMFVHAAPWLVGLAALVWANFATPWLARNRVNRASDQVLRQRLHGSRGLFYWALMAGAGLFASALGYSTQWAEPNAFIPGVVLGAAFLCVGLPRGGWKEVVGLALGLAQLLFALVLEPTYQPIQNEGIGALDKSYRVQQWSRTVPSDEQVQRARALRIELERSDGEVFALRRPWWSVLAGGSGHVGTMGLSDVLERPKIEIQRTLAQEIKAVHYQQLWFEGEPPRWLRNALRGYRVERRYQGDVRVRPMSGYMSEAGMVTPYRGDQLLFVPIGPRPAPPGVRVIADFEGGRLAGFRTDGRAFGRRAVRGTSRGLPAVGPYGGEYLLSSAGARGDLAAQGEALSPAFQLATGGVVEFLVGTSGRSTGLRVEVVHAATDESVVLKLPRARFQLETVRWVVPESWGGRRVQLRLTDASGKAALYFDDLWVSP